MQDLLVVVYHQYQKLFLKKGKSLIPFRNVQNLLYFLIVQDYPYMNAMIYKGDDMFHRHHSQ